MTKKILIGVILSCFLILVTPCINAIEYKEVKEKYTFNCNDSINKYHWLFTYNSYIEFDFDTDLINYPLPIGELIVIPINVTYETDIPDFFNNIPSFISNLFLFQRIIKPYQIINFSIEDIPDWADILVSPQHLFMDIPYYDDVTVSETSLLLLLKTSAPAEPYTITIRASCDAIGRVNEFSYEVSISFTPEYYPNIEIYGNTTFITPPNERIDIPITVVNKGNKISKITPTIVNDFSDWLPLIVPSFVEVNVDDSSTFILSITAPNNFNDVKILEMDFIVEGYPFHVNRTIGHFPYFLTFQYR